MKRIMVLLLALLLAGSCVSASAAPGNELGLKALIELWDGKSNCFVSPVSLGYALSLAAVGAEGQTRDELLDALCAQNAETIAQLNRPLRASGLKIANAAFVAERVPLKDGYKNKLGDVFDAALFPLDDPERVNAWVKQNTDGLIEKLVDELPDTAAMLLINALAMDAKWAEPFEAELTGKAPFLTPEGEVEVDMMRGIFTADYAERDGLKLMRLAYRDSDLYMLLALPDDGDIAGALAYFLLNDPNSIPFELQSAESIIEDIISEQEKYGEVDEDTRKELRSIYTDPRPYLVSLRLPKLDLSLSAELSGALMQSGINKAFEPDADFSGISEHEMFIQGVLQKLRVQVDEEGTRAAAVTEIIFADGAALYLPVPKEFNCDRPFVMLIVDGASGAICFAGAVTNPLG